MAPEAKQANLVCRRSRASRHRRCWSWGLETWYTVRTSGVASNALGSASAGPPWPYSRSRACRRAVLRFLRDRWPLHILCMCCAALNRSLSCCLCARSAWACATVWEAPGAARGAHDVLVKGFIAFWPLRLTFRPLRELPVKVGNMINAEDGRIPNGGL